MSTIQQLLTEHFDIWTSADTAKKTGRGRSSSNADKVYGIKKLRELILELAVRGKLVPQDPNDEPASEFLKRIQKEKTRLIAEGKIKKEKPLAPVSEEEKPFELPKGWEWARLGSLAEIKGGKRLPAGETFSLVETPYIYIQVTNMKNGTIVHENLKYIDEKTHAQIKQYTISANDLYITIAGTIGDVGSVPDFFCGMNLTENAAKIVFTLLNKEWLKLTLRSALAQKQFLNETNQLAQPKLALHRIANSIVSIPPYAEQFRINLKVQELMLLCDQLENKHNNTTEAHERLASYVLDTLTRSQSAEEFNENWQLIAANFDILFITESSIDALKQTLLQLAVMGKLVPQDLNDEPASELLKRIHKEKVKLIAEGEIKKEKPLSLVTEDEKPFELPMGWEWARIGDVVQSTNYGLSEKTFEISKGVPVLKMGDIQDGNIVLGGQKKIGKNVEGLPELYLNKGDLLYNRTNSAELVGKTGVYEGVNDEYTFASYLIRIRCIENLMFPYYLNLVMNSLLFRETQIVPHLKQQCGQANVNGTIMKNMIVAVPPFNEQKLIFKKANELAMLCNELKLRITKAGQFQQKIADIIVEKGLI